MFVWVIVLFLDVTEELGASILGVVKTVTKNATQVPINSINFDTPITAVTASSPTGSICAIGLFLQ